MSVFERIYLCVNASGRTEVLVLASLSCSWQSVDFLVSAFLNSGVWHLPDGYPQGDPKKEKHHPIYSALLTEEIAVVLQSQIILLRCLLEEIY